MQQLIYNLAILLYYVLICALSPFNVRAKKMIKGRERLWSDLSSFRNLYPDSPVVWVHAASVGEFEQARLLMEKIQKERPHIKIVLTFFSSSGYDMHCNYSGVDKVLYLPFDFPSRAEKFVQMLNPALVIFVKYEFWLNFITQIHRKKIPQYLISAVFHDHQPFFKWYGKKFRDSLHCFDFIFVQDKVSAEKLKTLQQDKYMVCGDTRYDRVFEILSNPAPLATIEKFTENSFVVIAGSSYETEEKMLLNIFDSISKSRSDIKLILVPHHIHDDNIRRIANLLHQYKIHFSQFSKGVDESHRVLVVDTFGMLSSLYRLCKLAVIGGGFNDGIHSVLEPAVFGLPVFFGPNYRKFNEAIQLLDMQSAFAFKNENELRNRLCQIIDDIELYKSSSDRIKSFTAEQCGATEKIFKHIQWP